jgi:hypothetical protein
MIALHVARKDYFNAENAKLPVREQRQRTSNKRILRSYMASATKRYQDEGIAIIKDAPTLSACSS